MSECDVSKLDSSSKARLIGLMIALIIGGGAIGCILASSLMTCEEPDEPDYTVLDVTVNDDFYIDIETIYPLGALDADPCNCSSLIVGGQFFSNTFYNETMEWLEENLSRVFDDETIIEDLGLDEIQSGMHVEFISDGFMSPEATENSTLNGKTFTVSFGENAVLLLVSVGVYIDDTLCIYTFVFNETMIFIEAVDEEEANYTIFSDAMFLQGKNSMTINGITVVEEEQMLLEMETILDVTFNGVNMTMVLSPFGFF